MTDCVPVRIAEAIASEINAATWSLAFEAVYSFADSITKLEDINAADGLLVDVLPAMRPDWTLQGQAVSRHDVVVKVGLRRRIEPAQREVSSSIATAEITQYCNLLYEILAAFSAGSTPNSGRPLTSLPEVAFNPRAKVQIQLYDEVQLRQGLYVGWVHLPFVTHEGA